MCSISGFFAEKKPLPKSTAERLARALLYYGKERGRQSAGAFVLNSNGRGLLDKRAQSPTAFIESKGFKALFTDGARLALFHTRLPTCGDRTDKQAQPFTGATTGVNGLADTVTTHNGYYFDHSGLRASWGIDNPSGVDSELVTSFIDAHGVGLLPEFLKSTDGPNAVAVYHKGALYLARDTNPLHYAKIRLHGQRVTVWASTYEQLTRALDFVLLADFHNIKELTAFAVFKVGGRRLKRVNQWHSADGVTKQSRKSKRKAKREIINPFWLDELADCEGWPDELELDFSKFEDR